jgi:hypothetical protein
MIVVGTGGPLGELDGIVSEDLVLVGRGRERRRAAGTAGLTGGGMAGWRVSRRFQAQQLPEHGPGRQGGPPSVLRRVPVDRRRERALFDDVGVHAFQRLAERPHQAVR